MWVGQEKATVDPAGIVTGRCEPLVQPGTPPVGNDSLGAVTTKSRISSAANVKTAISTTFISLYDDTRSYTSCDIPDTQHHREATGRANDDPVRDNDHIRGPTHEG